MAATILQTLDRGLAALHELADAPDGLRPAELALRLGVHKAIAYRLIATLEHQGLARRMPDGRAVPGLGLITLAARVEESRIRAAAPHLAALSEAARATACLVLAEGADAVVAAVQEGGDGVVRVTYRLGMRHPLDRGATGLAILAGRPPAPAESPRIAAARAAGFAMTQGELQQGAEGLAAPVLTPATPRPALEAAVGVVALGPLAPDAAAHVLTCAARLRELW